MIHKGQEFEVPAVLHLSFYKLIESLKIQAESDNEPYASLAKSLLAEAEKYPELLDGITDFDQLERYKEPIQKLGKMLFPEALMNNEIKALTAMFYGEPLLLSKRFEGILSATDKKFEDFMTHKDPDLLYRAFCFMILGKYYGYPVLAGGTPQIIKVFNKLQGVTRFYKMLINADMIEFIPTEKAISITETDFRQLINNFDNVALWKEKFPPNSWTIRGVTLISLVDITVDHSITEINANLLNKNQDSFENVRESIRRMIGIPDLAIGVLTIEDDQLVIASGDEKNQSIILTDKTPVHCETEMCDTSYGQLMLRKEAFVVTDIEAFHQQTESGFSKRLSNSGYQSFALIPLEIEGEFLGYMELGAKKAYSLHKGVILVLDNITPILSMAFQQFEVERQNTIEAIIQQECTTIHPSVKWRFEEEAEKFAEAKFNGKPAQFTDIIFNKLYPLYGQLDIKGSSRRRNEAVSTDLTKQLAEVNKILKAALNKTKMPVFGQLSLRTENYILELDSGLAAGSEHKILGFVKNEIYPVFEHLMRNDREISKLIKAYRKLLDPNLHSIYEARKEYDTSVNYINDRLATYLDQKQEEAQKMFPHYFERYKTDGVEFNIYIGASIARDREFSPIYLRNLRIWQLQVMCELERAFKGLQQELNSTIEVASLILVYNTPLSVHFRMDEKQFDVEGAYNARYEIIKKRVDKAHIKGTNERITQPKKLAIVYSQEQDAQEYIKYLEYLIDRGYLKDDIENLPLEELQGVAGLKALRVGIRYDSGKNTAKSDQKTKKIAQGA